MLQVRQGFDVADNEIAARVQADDLVVTFQCESCRAEKLVAFSCKRRGFCPSCGGRRMAETAALLVDEVLPRAPIRQRAQFGKSDA